MSTVKETTAKSAAAMSHICPLNKRPCRCDAKSQDKKIHPCRITKRIGQFVGMMLGSSSDGESSNAATALRRFIESEGVPANDLTMILTNWDGQIEERKYSDSDVEIIFERGKEAGRTEETRNRPLGDSTEYYDADGNPQWHAIALYCQRHGLNLPPNHREFIDDMTGNTMWREPTPKQGKYLLSLFFKLGRGKRR
jgi:hypothetical protein